MEITVVSLTWSELLMRGSHGIAHAWLLGKMLEKFRESTFFLRRAFLASKFLHCLEVE